MEHTRQWISNNTYHKCRVLLPELDARKSMMWNFHLDDSQENSWHDMVIGWYLFLDIQMYQCLSDYTIRSKLIQVRQEENVVRTCVHPIFNLWSEIMGQKLLFCMYSD